MIIYCIWGHPDGRRWGNKDQILCCAEIKPQDKTLLTSALLLCLTDKNMHAEPSMHVYVEVRGNTCRMKECFSCMNGQPLTYETCLFWNGDFLQYVLKLQNSSECTLFSFLWCFAIFAGSALVNPISEHCTMYGTFKLHFVFLVKKCFLNSLHFTLSQPFFYLKKRSSKKPNKS